MLVTLTIDNINIKLGFDGMSDKTIAFIKDKIHESLDPLDPNRYRNRLYHQYDKYGRRVWDGRFKICDLKNNLVPTGLFDELDTVLRSLKNYKIHYKINDVRGSEFSADIPEHISFKGNGKEKDITLRDYQQEAVENALHEQLGVVLSSTNSGKTMIAISIFSLLLDKLEPGQHLLFIAPNVSIMTQVYHKFQHYLGDDNIGIWGNSQCDINHPIVCATIQTMASALKKPQIKITKPEEKWLQRLDEVYGPDIVSHGGNPRANLKLLALNFVPKFKYESDYKDRFQEMYTATNNDDEVRELIDAYRKKYIKTMEKKNKKGFGKYHQALTFLDSVRGIVCDEVHFAGADSYWKVVTKCNNARLRIGMTGTIDKSLNIKTKRIKALFGSLLINISNKQMITRGVSAKPHIIGVPCYEPKDLDVTVESLLQKEHSNVSPDLRRYQLAYKYGVIDNEDRNRLIAELAYKSSLKIGDKTVLIIVNSLEQGDNICEQLDKLHANYEYIKGEDNNEIREQALSNVKQGKTNILLGTKIIDTGIDVANFKVLIEASAGKSYISLLHRIGRILRVQRDKMDVYVFDIVDKTSTSLWKHAERRFHIYKEQGFDIK